MAGRPIGDALLVRAPGGPTRSLTLSGAVRDAALPPAPSEGRLFLYGDQHTLSSLVPGDGLDELRLQLRDAQAGTLDDRVAAISQDMQARGVIVHATRVPPLGRHPHQGPFEAVMAVFGVSAVGAVLLAVMLSSTLLEGLLRRRGRESAVLAALGASSLQLRTMGVAPILPVVVGALLLAVPAGHALGSTSAEVISSILGFEVVDPSAPLWGWGTVVAVGTLAPLSGAWLASGRTIHQPTMARIRDHGIRVGWRPPLRHLSPLDRFVVRSLLVAPARLVRTAGLLGVAGGMVLTAAAVGASWDRLLAQVPQHRRDDAEVWTARELLPADAAALADLAESELWSIAPALPISSGGVQPSRTYPDQGHGSLRLVGVPAGSILVSVPLEAGRWIGETSRQQAVVNGLAARQLGVTALGQTIHLQVADHPTRWEVVGLSDEVAAPASVYVSSRAAEAVGVRPQVLRVALDDGVALSTLEDRLESMGAPVVRAMPRTLLLDAMAEHVVVLVISLGALGGLVSVVGAVALSTALSTSVLERTRQLAVLVAVGARERQVGRLVRREAWLVMAASLPVTVLVALAGSLGLGALVGELSFGVAMPLGIPVGAIGAWLLLLAGLGTVAAALPTRAVLRLPVLHGVRHG